ncbi:MAG: class I SAM-dependent methyltransferase [Nocardioides sp.]|nr:class I SAM-dependent methyltransferase [Nocardioides sp.]
MSGVQTPALWDTQAASFDQEADHGLLDADTRAAWRDLLQSVLPAAPARIADLGCGTGSLSGLLAEAGHVVGGIDFSPRMVERARAKAAATSATVEFAVGDAAAPDLTPAAYDVVLCRHLLWALPDPEAALERWVHLLAPGGRLVLIEGHWSTGAGLTVAECRRLVEVHRSEAEVVLLTDPVLWGKEITDERYLLLSGA